MHDSVREADRAPPRGYRVARRLMSEQIMHRFTPLALLAGLVRRTWLVAALTVVTCAAFAANAASALIEADYLIPAPRAVPPPVRRVRAPPTAPPVLRDGEQLVGRDMFCSSCTPGDPAAPAAGTVLGSAVLIAIELGQDARATVRVVASEVQGSWGVGDAIPGLGRVDRIGRRSIEVIDGSGHRGRLALLDAAAGGGPVTAMTENPPAARPWADRIKKLDEQNYEVDRSLVRELVSAGARPGGPRFLPIVQGGEVKGVQLSAVRSGSILFELGLRDRDTLSAIDGAPLKALDQLLDIYAKLDQLSAVELSGTRGGRPLVRTLRLR